MNILRAEDYLKRYVPQSTLVSDVYDDDEMLSAALLTLFPDFEYPDFAHLTLSEVLKRYSRAPRPLTGLDSASQPRLPHYTAMTNQAVMPGMSRADINELGAHCHAAWRSEFGGQPIRLFRLTTKGEVSYLMRTEAEDIASAEPMPLSAFVALYVNGRATARIESPMLAVLDERLAGIISPLPPEATVAATD